MQGAVIGLFGATLATFGYETVVNLLGKAGIGKRGLEILEDMVRVPADDHGGGLMYEAETAAEN